MTTPIQELIDLLEEEYKKFDAEDEVVYWFHNRGIRQAIKHAESMLEKEKDVILDAWLDDRFPLDKEWAKQCAEAYYNETFNVK